MPVRTITAEIDGTVRRVHADIPDGASQDDIVSAIGEWVAKQPKIPGMEKLGVLPGVPPTRLKALEGPPEPERMAGGTANLPPRNMLEKAADVITLGGTRKFREGVEEIAPETGKSGTEQKIRGARHIFEGGMQAMTPKALGAALETAGAAPTLIRGLIAVAKPYLIGAGVGAATNVGSQVLGASPETGKLAGEVVGAAAGVGSGGLRKQEVKPAAETGGLPKIPYPVRLVLKAKGLGKLADLYDTYAASGKTVAEIEKPQPFRPNPAIANKMRYGGSYEPELQVGKSIPRKGLKPVTKEMPESRSAPATVPAAAVEQASTVNTTKAAVRLKETGVTKGKWEGMSQKQKQDALAQAKYFGGVSQKDYKEISSALD